MHGRGNPRILFLQPGVSVCAESAFLSVFLVLRVAFADGAPGGEEILLALSTCQPEERMAQRALRETRQIAVGRGYPADSSQKQQRMAWALCGACDGDTASFWTGVQYLRFLQWPNLAQVPPVSSSFSARNIAGLKRAPDTFQVCGARW